MVPYMYCKNVVGVKYIYIHGTVYYISTYFSYHNKEKKYNIGTLFGNTKRHHKIKRPVMLLKNFVVDSRCK